MVVCFQYLLDWFGQAATLILVWTARYNSIYCSGLSLWPVELVRKIPEGHANLQQILQQKTVFNKAVENRVKNPVPC